MLVSLPAVGLCCYGAYVLATPADAPHWVLLLGAAGLAGSALESVIKVLRAES